MISTSFMGSIMSVGRGDDISVKRDDKSGNLNPGKHDRRDGKPLKLCPFYGFRVCNESCKYYACHGYCKIIAERIKKGYANEYLSSVLF